MTWALHDHVPRPPGEPPRLELLRLYSRMVGPSQKVLTCGLYRTDGVIEVRCGYGDDDPLRTRVVTDEAIGLFVATEWKAVVEAKGRFVTLAADDH